MEDEDLDFFDEDLLDVDYEYDAPQFFDFTHPETVIEAAEAENWFRSTGSYPPSPAIVKLGLISEDHFVEDLSASSVTSCSSHTVDGDTSLSDENNVSKYMAQYTANSKTKGLPKSPLSPSATFMRPTASHLAKLKSADNHCERLCRRFQRFPEKESGRSFPRTTLAQIQDIKRQELEAGFLRKVAYLKHQALLEHKASKQDGSGTFASVYPKPKLTVPKAPILRTANRADRHAADRHRSMSNIGSTGSEKSNKAQPLTRKFSEAHALPLPRRRISHTEFQVFHFKTLERAAQRASNHGAAKPRPSSSNEVPELKRQQSVGSRKQGGQVKVSALRRKESYSTADKSPSGEPPAGQFSKLSLTSHTKRS